MPDFTIALSIPQQMIDQLRQMAKARGLPVEQVILKLIEASLADSALLLPPGAQAELDALANLSDEALRTIAHEQMDPDQQEQMHLLMRCRRLGTITEAERAELMQYEEQSQRLALRKSKAMALLTARGHTVHLVDSS